MPGLHFLRLAVITLCIAVGIGSSQAQQLEKRIALVIGNGAYQSGDLTTPANDAGLIAQTLQAAGFDVVGARDLDIATLRSSLREFLDKARASGPDTVAFVYFAGHGLQFEGENYLIPVDARIARDTDLPLEAVRLTDLSKPLAAMPLKARIVVLDAARPNSFAKSGQPLAGGLALMQPDPGMLLAYSSAPGTIGVEDKASYGAYATALSEMIKVGGLPLDELFERVRLRVDELTRGGELTWHVSRLQVPFLFFERTQAAPQVQADRFSELRSRPIRDFDASEAYLAALTRDTMRGYLDFLAAYPGDPLAKRVRAIVAARRESSTWRESALADTPDAYWSYLRRYPRGPHAYDAHRRLSHFAAVLEPPASFAMLAYDIPPPPADEAVYIERPVVYLADPIYDLPPPPPVPLFFLPPRPAYFVDLPPPPPPLAAFVLPIPIYHPVPVWIERPNYVAPPPVNIVNVNIHNTVVINQANQTAIVTNPSGQQVAPIPANLLASQPAAPTQAPGTGQPNVVQAHPVVSAAIAATAVALPAALRAASQRARPANLQGGPSGIPLQAATPNPSGTRPLAPVQAAPARAGFPGPQPLPGGHPQLQRPGQPPALPGPGAQPLPIPHALPVAGRNPPSQPAAVAQTPPAPMRGAQRLPKGPGSPLAAPQPPRSIGQPVRPLASTNAARPLAAGPQRAVTNDAARQRQQQAVQQQALQQQALQQRASQQRALQASQQRQQQISQAAAQQRAMQAAQQRQQQASQQAAQQRAVQAAQQRARPAMQQAAPQRAAPQQQQRRPNCGHPGELPCR